MAGSMQAVCHGMRGRPTRCSRTEPLTLTRIARARASRSPFENPDYLTGPATLTQQWDHRTDLEFAPEHGARDPEVARRYQDDERRR
jgi:hypothetical protein